jgi:small subunit ribosomal protein S16
VLTDSKNSTKSGRFKEVLGSYDPRKSTDSLNAERIKYWLGQGASPTDTVHNLLVRHKIIKAKKINVSARSKKAPSSAEATAGKPTPKVEKNVPEVAPTTVKDDITPTLARGEIGAPTEASE